MEEVTFNEEDVKIEIKSINKNKSSGPDDIDIKMRNKLCYCSFSRHKYYQTKIGDKIGDKTVVTCSL